MARRTGEKRGPGLREDKMGSIERQGLLLRGERGGRRNARCGRFTLVHLIKPDGGKPVRVCQDTRASIISGLYKCVSMYLLIGYRSFLHVYC